MTEANAGQAEFWNSEPGGNWVDFQPTSTSTLCALRPGERVLDSVAARRLHARARRRRRPVRPCRTASISPPRCRARRAPLRDAGSATSRFPSPTPGPRLPPGATTSPLALRGHVLRRSGRASATPARSPGGRLVFRLVRPETNPWVTLPPQDAGPPRAARRRPRRRPGPMASAIRSRLGSRGAGLAGRPPRLRLRPAQLGRPRRGDALGQPSGCCRASSASRAPRRPTARRSSPPPHAWTPFRRRTGSGCPLGSSSTRRAARRRRARRNLAARRGISAPSQPPSPAR